MDVFYCWNEWKNMITLTIIQINSFKAFSRFYVYQISCGYGWQTFISEQFYIKSLVLAWAEHDHVKYVKLMCCSNKSAELNYLSWKSFSHFFINLFKVLSLCDFMFSFILKFYANKIHQMSKEQYIYLIYFKIRKCYSQCQQIISLKHYL